MDIGTLIGVVGGLVLIVVAILLKASLSSFYDTTGIIIVFGGTIAATLASFPMESVIHAMKTSIKIFFSHRIDQKAVLKEMILLASVARKQGAVAMEKYKTKNQFLKKAVLLSADGTKPDILKSILELERDSIEERHVETQVILEKMGDLAPAWGMIGTLVGLVIMLLNLDNPASIGPAMAVALLTTFYGAFWANFFLIPASSKLEQRTKRETLSNNLVIETMVSIGQNESPLILQERLLGFLPSKERKSALPGKGGKKKGSAKK